MEVALNTLHPGLTYEEYVSIIGLRSSDLKLLKRSPAHWKSKVEDKSTEALEFGALFHLAIENPEKFKDTCIIEPIFEGMTQGKNAHLSTKSAEAKAKKEQWHLVQRSSGKTIVPSGMWQPLTGMLNACTSHKLVSNLLKNGVRETSLWVEDEETGVILKARPDFVSSRGHMVDIKTSRDATYPSFYNDIFSSRGHDSTFYVLQAAHYAHCARLSKVCKGDAFYFVAIEKEPPYGIKVWTMDEGCLAPGELWRSKLTKLYKECQQKEIWPCYDEAAEQVLPPQWVETPPENIEHSWT